MTQITPSLLAAAYAGITTAGAPRANDLSVVGLAAADIPPVSVEDTVFPDNATLSASSTLGGVLAGASAYAASSVGLDSPASVFAGGSSTASHVLGLIIDESV